MRLYRIQDIDIDLDMVLAVHRPRIGFIRQNSCYEQLFFKVTIQYLENPITIIYQYNQDERAAWMDNYFKEHPGQVRHNCEPFMDEDWLESEKPKFDQIHADFIKAWENKDPIVTVTDIPTTPKQYISDNPYLCE